LLYQSRKRGILETDLLLSTFAKEHLPTMSLAEMQEYDRLMDEPDWDIYYWATKSEKRAVPQRWTESTILRRLQEHSKNAKREILRMPEL
jgi:succinate dehydrogenase assembly factor 2